MKLLLKRCVNQRTFFFACQRLPPYTPDKLPKPNALFFPGLWHEIDNKIFKTIYMSARNQSPEEKPDQMADKGRGMQGIDKAPGEEPASTTEQFTSQTQKGKNKVDGDPSKESDRPLDRQDIQ